MTLNASPGQPTRPLVRSFPTEGSHVRLAYRELHLAINGTPEQKQAIGSPARLPRPWEPATCTYAALRKQLWEWLDAVVTWLNDEYTWDVAATIPTCWPAHPHLVHEIAVLADQRRRAGLALTSDALEEWHRYAFPFFLDRLRGRLRSHCEEGHQEWPGRSRRAQHVSAHDTTFRQGHYTRDMDALPRPSISTQPVERAPRLGLVDLDTGYVLDGSPDD